MSLDRHQNNTSVLSSSTRNFKSPSIQRGIFDIQKFPRKLSFGQDNEDAFGQDNEDALAQDNEDALGQDNEDAFAQDNEDVFGQDNKDALALSFRKIILFRGFLAEGINLKEFSTSEDRIYLYQCYSA